MTFNEKSFIDIIINEYYENEYSELRPIFDKHYELIIGSNTEKEEKIRQLYPKTYYNVIINGMETKHLITLQYILFNKIDYIIDEYGDSTADTEEAY
jgi:hypothetical protein